MGLARNISEVLSTQPSKTTMTTSVVSLRSEASPRRPPVPQKRVAVFAGTSGGNLPIYEQAANELGQALVEQGIGLMIEAGSSGILRAVTAPLLAAGVSVVQVGMLQEVRGTNLLGNERWEVADRHQARHLLLENANGVLFLPGGVESCAAALDSVFSLLSHIPRKPLGLLDTGAFFLPLLGLLTHLSASGFLREDWQDYLYSEPRPRPLLTRLLNDPTWRLVGAEHTLLQEVDHHG